MDLCGAVSSSTRRAPAIANRLLTVGRMILKSYPASSRHPSRSAESNTGSPSRLSATRARKARVTPWALRHFAACSEALLPRPRSPRRTHPVAPSSKTPNIFLRR